MEEGHGTWIFLAPISHLILARSPTYKIVRCELVRASSLPHCRKRIGFKKRISEITEKHTQFIKPFFEKKKAFLTLRLTGKGAEMRPRFVKHCEDELYILALSQLGYGNRSSNGVPCITDQYQSGKVSFLLFNSNDNSWTQPNYITGHILELALDDQWHKFHSAYFFHTLLKILRNEIEVEKQWRETLYNASVLAGMSQCSNERTTAFLWNMIAVEMLLTLDGEKHAEILPERVEAFLGWVFDWNEKNYSEKIQDCYKKRCAIVHNGDRSCVEKEDLFFTDSLLFNLFTNLVRHHSIFKGKQDIKTFSEKVKAEHLLGLKSNVRPKTLTFTQKQFRENDYQRI